MNRKCDVLIYKYRLMEGVFGLYADDNLWEFRQGYKVTDNGLDNFMVFVDPRYDVKDVIQDIADIAHAKNLSVGIRDESGAVDIVPNK